MSVTAVDVVKPKSRAKKQAVWRCQFCAQGLHRSCPRVVWHGAALWRCLCEENCEDHAGLHCTVCKHDRVEDINPEIWRCIESTACQTRHEARKDTNPIWRMVHAAKVHSAVVRRQKRRMDQLVECEIDPTVDQHIDELTSYLHAIEDARKIKPKVKRQSTPRTGSGQCECCGGATRGGRFLPGHDAKLASVLKHKVVHNKDVEAYEDMKKRGWLSKLPVDYRDGIKK